MVWVLQTRVQDELSFNRRLDTRQAAQLASSPAGQARKGQRHRPSTLAKRILCAAGLIYADRSPCPSMSIREGGPVTGKPDAGNPPVRFGGRGGRNQPASPTPITRCGPRPRPQHLLAPSSVPGIAYNARLMSESKTPQSAHKSWQARIGEDTDALAQS